MRPCCATCVRALFLGFETRPLVLKIARNDKTAGSVVCEREARGDDVPYQERELRDT